MDLWIWIFLGVCLFWILFFKLRGKVGRERARELVKNGALMLDVRTEQEFDEKHLTGAVNLPLSEVAEKIPSVEPDKERVILCFCVSGGRSAIAMGQLRKLGYRQAFNLGSYVQAAAVLEISN